MNDLQFQCPTCGAEVHPNSRGCGKCGARRETEGWKEPETYDGLDLPGGDDEFDYHEFIARELGVGEAPRRSRREVFWWVVAIVTLVAFTLVYAF